MRILYAITHHSSAQNFLRGQLRFMHEHGLEVHLACAPGPGLSRIQETDDPTLHLIPTERKISLFKDIRSLVAYYRLMLALRPDIVNGSTPKAALLSLLAARIARVPRRIYVLRGMRAETVTGFNRAVLNLMERITSWAATEVIAVSPSLRDEYVLNRLNMNRPVHVLGAGSSNGVDSDRFRPPSLNEKNRARAELGLIEGKTVVSFIGRVTPDKGVALFLDIAEEFRSDTRVHFLVQGEIEDPLLGDRLEHTKGNVTYLSWGEPICTLAATNILVLPTLREGFPNVVLEAACMEIPSVTTMATGARDSVLDGITGLLVPIQDFAALKEAVSRLVYDRNLRYSLGVQARHRAQDEFDQRCLWLELLGRYKG